MAIEDTFEALRLSLERLGEKLHALQSTVIADQPISSGALAEDGSPIEFSPVLVSLATGVAELTAHVQEATEASQIAGGAVRDPADGSVARENLMAAQISANRLLRLFLIEVSAYDTLQALGQIGASGGPGWSEWVGAVRGFVDDCRPLVVEVHEAIAAGWQDLAGQFATSLRNPPGSGVDMGRHVPADGLTNGAAVGAPAVMQADQISRALAAVAAEAQNAFMVLDSVFLGPVERETTMLTLTGERAPITLAELLGWVQNFAANEGPRLLRSAGSGGVASIRASINRLAYLVFLSVQFSRSTRTAERGVHSVPVQEVLSNLLVTLRQAVIELNRNGSDTIKL